MDRLNHVKIVTPDPDAVDRFLRQVLELPEGWPLGDPASIHPVDPPPSSRRETREEFTVESVRPFQGTSKFTGRITGSTESRQFQIVQGDSPRIWAVAIGTRHLERAHERCVERGIPCTEPDLAQWGEGGVRFFFAEVGGIVFEVMRAEDTGPA